MLPIDRGEELEQLRLAIQLAGVEVDDVGLPQEHDVVVDRMRLHYLDWGQRGRRPMLFLHGGGLTAHTWDVVCASLRTQYRCLALDQRGHGDSEWSPEMDYGPDAHLRDIEGFVDRLGLERFILVGMSLGGLNAMRYAARHCDRLDCLVVIDTGPSVRLEGGRRIADFVTQTEELDSVDEFVERAMRFNPLRDPRLLRRSLLYNLRSLPNGKLVRKNDMRHWGRVRVEDLTARAAECWAEVGAITCPTLVVRGADSDVFLDEDAERFAWALPKGQWVRIEGAGHTVQGDNPRALLDAMRRFLGDAGV